MSLLYELIDPDEVYKLKFYNPQTEKFISIDKKGSDLNYFEAEYILESFLEQRPYQKVILNNHFKIYKN